MMKKIFSSMIALFLLALRGVSAETLPQHFSLDAFVANIQAKDYLPYILEEGKLEPLNVPALPPSDVEKLVWADSNPQILGRVDEATLHFEKQASSTEQEAVNESFDVSLHFHRDFLIVRHSKPALAREAGGLSFKNEVGRRPVRMSYIQGADAPDLKIFVPFPVNKKQSQAILMCLREPERIVSKDKRHEEVILRATENYRLAEMTGSGDIRSSVKLISGGHPSLGLTALQTTKNVTPSFPFVDKVYSEDPIVSLSYTPQNDAPLDTATSPLGAAVGYRAMTDFINGAGYHRQTARDFFVLVRRLSDEDGKGYEFPNPRELDSLKGCYLMLHRDRVGVAYQKDAVPTQADLANFGDKLLVFPKEHTP